MPFYHLEQEKIWTPTTSNPNQTLRHYKPDRWWQNLSKGFPGCPLVQNLGPGHVATTMGSKQAQYWVVWSFNSTGTGIYMKVLCYPVQNLVKQRKVESLGLVDSHQL